VFVYGRWKVDRRHFDAREKETQKKFDVLGVVAGYNLLVVNVSVPVKWYSKRKHKHSSTRDSASRSVVSHGVVSTQDTRYCDKSTIERKVNDDGYKDLGDWLAT
jgi:hypothetical protein